MSLLMLAELLSGEALVTPGGAVDRETACKMTPLRPDLSAPPARPAATRAAGAADLIGWSIRADLLDDALLTPHSERRVLAAALGVEETALEAFEPQAVRAALGRMRHLVALCEQLASEAAIDDLTGAMRRGMGLAALQREIDRSRRPNGPNILVAFIDVDGLKSLNDTRGHSAGDRLLRDVVTAVRERIRSYDILLRYGGDEFVCVLIDVTVAQAERTIADIRRNVTARTGEHTISVGLASVIDGDNAEAVVVRADMALYSARRTLTGRSSESQRSRARTSAREGRLT